MKKMLVIMLAVIMALSTAACGTVQPTTQTTPAPAVEVKPEVTPAPEVSEPEPTEAPKEEPEATEVVEETPEVTEEVAEDTEPEEENPFILNGVDYEGKFIGMEEIYQFAEGDSLKAYVLNGRGQLVAVLFDGDSFVQEETVHDYSYIIYTPKIITKQKNISGPECTCEDWHDVHTGRIAARCEFMVLKSGENVPFGIEVTYEDGTEEAITFYVTKDYTGAAN